MQLKDKIKALEKDRDREIDTIKVRYAKEIEKHRDALEVLEKMNEACLDCGGTGRKGQLDAAGGTEVAPCQSCRGTGKRGEVV